MADEVAGPVPEVQPAPVGESEEVLKQGRAARQKRLETLKCFPVVNSMIENAYPVHEIVTYIRETAKEYTDVTPKSLKVILYRYIQDKWKTVGAGRRPVGHRTMFDTDVEKVEVQNGLQALLAIQMRRIDIMFEKEQTLGMLMHVNNAAVRIAADLLTRIDHAENSDLVRRVKGMATKKGDSADDQLTQIDRVKQSYMDKYGGDARARILIDDGMRRKLVTALEKVRKGESKDFLELIRSRMSSTTQSTSAPDQSEPKDVTSSSEAKPEGPPGDPIQ